MKKAKPLSEIIEYNFKENNLYDDLAIEFVNEHSDIVYNDTLVEMIKERIKPTGVVLTKAQEEALKTRVYFAKCYWREKANEGKNILNISNFQELAEYDGKKIEFIHNQDIFGKRLVVGKIKVINGEVRIMPLKARTRSWVWATFIGDEYKIIE